MKPANVHVRIDADVWQRVKNAVRESRLSGSLGQIVERSLRKELAASEISDSEPAQDSQSAN